ncbi:Inosose dehydratase [Lacunisphaera limnophila]|uniref:Inosose dehydratase n=1 Tax=Lacunisphaera limnophila TaxID=1838286 RepID=A0A1D8AY71_9BACT|nr:sugar phosphate isomerase/epimerase [Lacunisphaera limnophila]AOS45833.1 Inosose dehydratase [Lacunisphaera limnophila]
MKTPRWIVLLASLVTLAAAAGASEAYKQHLGLQLWSLRDQMKADIPAALDWVKAQGLTEVETAGLGSYTAEQFLQLLNDRGLKAVSAHIGYDDLNKDLAGAINTAKILGAKYVMTAWIPHGKEGLTAELTHQAIANFNKWGAAFRAEGITYGYHPHGYEFVPFSSEGGKTAFDLMVEKTNPDHVSFEMDVFWVFHAGVDPAALLKKHPTRWTLLHVKDIRKGAVTGLSTGGAPPIDNVAVGTGQIDWPAVLGAAQDIGVKHYLIEDETPTPLVCIPDSLKYLRALKL